MTALAADVSIPATARNVAQRTEKRCKLITPPNRWDWRLTEAFTLDQFVETHVGCHPHAHPFFALRRLASLRQTR
jgi:hypothetical protein